MTEYVMEYDGWAEGIPAGEYLKVCSAMHARKREEIVRCRDCAKWSSFDTEDGKRIGDCSEWTHLDGFSHATNEDGFCAWGERRDA